MIYFNNDYSEGCHPNILEALQRTNFQQTFGYGEDEYCRMAADKIRAVCEAPEASVHFLVGGTQTNMTVIDALLRPHQGALCAISGHINGHETGAVEATGHKVLTLPSDDGKITAAQVERYVLLHRADGAFEHMVQPKLVYISNPTEWGTIYTKAELEALSETCRKLGLYLFLDGARLGYGLVAQGNDLTMADLARLCDVFYIGGTKVGALFGEAVVFRSAALAEDFRYLIKQHGGMFAKGRLLGLQVDTLFTDGLYFEVAKHAIALADRMRAVFEELKVPFFVSCTTNQLFPVLPDAVLDKLAGKYTWSEIERVDESHRVARFCTSWATREENVEQFLADLREAWGN